MFMKSLFVKQTSIMMRKNCTSSTNSTSSCKFETVFSFPFVKYVGILNRLKVYQTIGTCVALPTSAFLEFSNVVPADTFYAASYVGLTATALLYLTSLPVKNVIGYLYINEDNSRIKISSLDFWGKRKDRIIATEDWIPISDIRPKITDVIYLSPCLTDGTKYKLFVKFGKVLNQHKIGQVLE